jgi:hypothetical protein
VSDEAVGVYFFGVAIGILVVIFNRDQHGWAWKFTCIFLWGWFFDRIFNWGGRFFFGRTLLPPGWIILLGPVAWFIWWLTHRHENQPRPEPQVHA